jgi:2-oxoglutarate ferredoxin oxidoreductase subunit delta
MARIVINADRCTGCGLCVEFCPKKNLRLAEELNARGIHTAERCEGTPCTGCKICVLMCPAAALSLYREDEKEDK